MLRQVWDDRIPAPRSEAARSAMALADELMPALDHFHSVHNRYPCFLAEMRTPAQLGPFSRPPYYQATRSGYQLFIENPGGTNMVRYRGSAHWYACSASSSCPNSEFSERCCGKERYPACEGRSPDADDSPDRRRS